MNLVVGSGPAGISCTEALLERGEKVLMLDAGGDLDPERQEWASQLAATSPEEWDPDLVAKVKAETHATKRGIPTRKVFGSSFVYDEVQDFIGIRQQKTKLYASFATGGLSNVWGAALLPYTERELDNWPIGEEDLAFHYQKSLALLPFAASKDDLESMFPLYASPQGAVPLTRQTREFLLDLQKNSEVLTNNGMVFGASRLALEANGDSGCVKCGLCLYGCPYGYVYNSRNTLEKFEKNPAFELAKPWIVHKTVENSDGVIIEAQHRLSGERRSFKGKRAFLGCGALSSAKILSNSFFPDKKLRLKVSQYFIFPFLRFSPTSKVESERLLTLSQLFLELSDKKLSPHLVHLQFYSYNELYKNVLKNMAGPFYPMVKGAISQLLNRLFIVQGYLHSDDSPEIELEFNADGSAKSSVVPRKQTADLVREFVKKIGAQKKQLKGVPLSFATSLGQPGDGSHVGGTFPMSEKPTGIQSDRLGRPFGLKRIHLIDSSTFPNIPAPTITFTVMANAHRIGTQATKENTL